MVDLRLVELPDGAAVRSSEKKSGAQRAARSTKVQREAKRALKADARIDADLSRAIDAITFLARNEIDPAPLIARISPMEAETVGANIQKAVDWLNQFADGWHVLVGNFETEGAPSGRGFEAGQGGLRLVRCRD